MTGAELLRAMLVYSLGHLVLILGLLALLARHPAYPRLIRHGAERRWLGVGLCAAGLILVQVSLSLRTWPHLPLLCGYLAGLPAALCADLVLAPCLLGLGLIGPQVGMLLAMGPWAAALRRLPQGLAWPLLALSSGIWVPLAGRFGWVPDSALRHLGSLSPEQRAFALVSMTLLWGATTPLVLRWAGYLAEEEERRRAVAAAAALRQQLAHQQAVLQKTRYRFLAAQIKPHFLFNSLTAVAGLILKDPDRAHDVVVELAHFLHPAFQERPDRIPLEEELGSLRAYLQVEQARLGERLTYTMEIEPGAGQAMLPSFVLQPLVENAVRHGLAVRPQGGRVVVAASRQDDFLLIRVEDDGAGFAHPVRGPLQGGSGVGLTNACERLRAAGGPDSLLLLESAPGQGTRIHIRLPWETTAPRPD